MADVMGIGSWEPHWIGISTHGRYAAFHRPEVSHGPAIVFVPPLLHEIERSRRFVTEVASSLAEMGLPCLRFDYIGTGDSSGHADAVSLDSLQVDICHAEAALRSLAGVGNVVVLAWRAASLPVFRWLKAGAMPRAVLMWEPVVDGAAWLEHLKRQDHSERLARRPYKYRLTNGAFQGDGHLLGFALSDRLRLDLADATLSLSEWRPSLPMWAILRSSEQHVSDEWDRHFTLPDGAPEFGGIDSTMFLSPPVERVVKCLGRALLEEL